MLDAVKSKGVGFQSNKKYQSYRKQRDNLINSSSTRNCRIDVNGSEVFRYKFAERVKKGLNME